MSVSFQNPVSGEVLAKLDEAFGKPVATDRKTFLYDRMGVIEQKLMSEVARLAKQPATVEVNAEGEIKELSDGTRYEVTAQGWKRLP